MAIQSILGDGVEAPVRCARASAREFADDHDWRRRLDRFQNTATLHRVWQFIEYAKSESAQRYSLHKPLHAARDELLRGGDESMITSERRR